MVDRLVPFWQLVYHGIILSNPFPPTCNYTIKDAATRLMLVEFGGRPFFYFYSNYRDNNDAWMGKEDLTCARRPDTDRQRGEDQGRVMTSTTRSPISRPSSWTTTRPSPRMSFG